MFASLLVLVCSAVVTNAGVAEESLDLKASDRTSVTSLRTESERSDYVRATSSELVEAFSEGLAQSRFVTRQSIGQTSKGRSIPLLIVADPPVNTPGDVGDRAVVLLFGSIHAGELCGTESLLMMTRKLVASRENGQDELLDKLVVCVMPIYNVDGHAEFGPTNRPGQNGPAEMGMRASGQGLDLNRDWVKMDAPETRAMVGFLNAWDPAVIVDTHTTNGSNHRFTLTYQGPKHPAGNPAVIEYVRDTMLPAVDVGFEKATGYDAFFYGNFAENHTKWTTYPAEPWYGVAYRGLRNRVSILTEAYAYASFKDRVLSTLAFCEAVLQYSAENDAVIRSLVHNADTTEIERGLQGATLAVKTEAKAFAKPATILGYQEPEDSGAHAARAKIDLATAEHQEYELPIFNDFVPTLLVQRPSAYAVPAEAEEVIDRLVAHGVEVSFMTQRVASLEVQAYLVDSVERSERRWEGRTRVTIEVSPKPAIRTLSSGTAIVKTDQRLGALASYMLEPMATGGFAAWDLFGDRVVQGKDFPVLRLDTSAVQALSLESTSLPSD